MSGSDLRPLSYGWVDKNNANSYALTPELPEATNGYNDGQIPPAKKYNHTMQRHAGWIAHLDAVAMRSDQLCGDTSVSRLSQYGFRFLTGAGLSQSVPDNSTYIIDGFIVDLALTRLGIEGYSPFLFTATKWTHWYISKDGVSFAVVNIGVAASPPGGSYHLGTVVTNGTDVTSWVAGNAIFADRQVNLQPNVGITGSLVVESTMTINDSSVLNGDLTVNNTSTFNGTSEWSVNSASPAITLANAGTGGGISYYSSSNGPQPMVDLVKTNSHDGTVLKLTAADGATSRALWILGGNGDSAAYVAAGAGQLGLELQGASTGTYAARFRGGAGQSYVAYFEAGSGGVGGNAGGALMDGIGTGAGAYVRGGDSAGAYALQALARNSTAQGAVFAQTHSTATTASRAGYFQGRDSAAGLEAVSAGYYAAILTPKNAAPTYGALRMLPQAVAPTQAFDGDLTCITSPVNGWAQGNNTEGIYHPLWASRGGYVYGAQYNQNAQSTGAYATVCTVTLAIPRAPKVAGEPIRCRATLRFRCNAAGTPTGVNVRIRDTTAGVNVIEYTGAGFATTNGFYLAATTVNWESSTVTIEMDYTPPATGARTFTLDIQRQGAITVTGQGSLVIFGI